MGNLTGLGLGRRTQRALFLLAFFALCSADGDVYGTEEDLPQEFALQECIRFALEHNAAVLASEEGARAAAARKKIAAAEYLPKVAAIVRYTHLDNERTLSTRMDERLRSTLLDSAAWWGLAESSGTAAANLAYDARDVDPFRSFYNVRDQVAVQLPSVQSQPILGQDSVEAQVLVTQPLFTGGKITQANRMAALGHRIQEEQVTVREDDVILGVTLAYLGALTSRQIREELDDLDARLNAVLTSINRILEGDSEKASTRDVAQIEMAIAGTERGIAESIRAEKVALAALREAMGFEDAAPLNLMDVGLVPVRLGREPGFYAAKALRLRAEKAQADLARQLGIHRVARAKADYCPDMALFGGFRYFADSLDVAGPDENQEWFAGVTVSLPIFEGFGRRAKVAAARHELAQARLVQTQVQRAIRLQVEVAYRAVRAAESQLEAADHMVDAASSLRKITTIARSRHIGTDYQRVLVISEEPEILELETVEYKEVPDVPEEIEAEIAESDAKVQRLAAVMELNAAGARLARALGLRSLEELNDEAGD